MAKLVNIVLMGENLKEAFEGVVEATIELKFVAENVKVSFKDKLATMGVDIDRTFDGDHHITENIVVMIKAKVKTSENQILL